MKSFLLTQFSILCSFFFSHSAFSQSVSTSKNISADNDRGLYAIWYEQNKDVLGLPFIYGGQIIVQWAEVETAEGVYDFTVLDDALKKMYQLGKKTTLQINGNIKPKYLYERIAANPKKLSPQIRDPQGSTLQFWDPLYLQYYNSFISAYGRHLKNSPYKSNIIGVRLNYNPIGTEHYFNEIGSELYKTTDADKDYHNYKPANNGHRYEYSFNDSILARYMSQVTKTFIETFTPEIKVLARYDGLMPGRETDSELLQGLENGKLGLFMTNSEARHARNFKTQIFLDFCKTGKAVGYAEQFSDAEGHHAGGLMNFPQWPSAWNYWRLLGDLDNGISYIAIYGTDLAKDNDAEFHSGFLFAKKYVGYHRSPLQSPGAWITLRTPGIISKEKINKTGPLENLTFLMYEKDSAGKMVINVGPKDQRFGSWARAIDKDESLSFYIDSLFKVSIQNKPARLHVIYLDDSTDPFTVSYKSSGKNISKVIERRNTQRWKEIIIDIPQAKFNSYDSIADISLTGGGIFHMIEIDR